MLIYVDPERQFVVPIPGRAHIVISLDATGRIATTSTYCFGSPDSFLGQTDDAKALQCDLPFLLEELRLQLALGRRLTVEESEPLNAKRRQSMATTQFIGV